MRQLSEYYLVLVTLEKSKSWAIQQEKTY